MWCFVFFRRKHQSSHLEDKVIIIWEELKLKAKQGEKNLCILRYSPHTELISEFLQCQSLFTLMNTVSWVQTGVIGHPQRKLNDQ